MSTRTITYDLTLISGSAAASKVVTFDLLTPLAARSTDTVVQVAYSSTADENGEGTVTLAVPSSGAYLYNCTLPDGQSFRFSLAAGDATTLHALMAATVGSTVTSADAITTAIDAHNADTTSVHGITDTSALVTTSDYTAADVLTKLLTVDGTGTGLDADTVDGSHASAFEAAGTVATHIADTSAVHDVTSLGTATGSSTNMLRVAAAGGLEYRTTAQVLSDIGAAQSASPTFTGTVTLPTTVASVIKPASDSTTALQLTNAAGTAVLTVDTTNKYVVTSGDLYVRSSGNTNLDVDGGYNGNGQSSINLRARTAGVQQNYFAILTNVSASYFSSGKIIYFRSDDKIEFGNTALSTRAAIFNTTTGLVHIGSSNISPTAFLDVEASTTAAASLRIRSGTAPTSPNDGDLYYDGSNLLVYVSSAWYTLDKTAV